MLIFHNDVSLPEGNPHSCCLNPMVRSLSYTPRPPRWNCPLPLHGRAAAGLSKLRGICWVIVVERTCGCEFLQMFLLLHGIYVYIYYNMCIIMFIYTYIYMYIYICIYSIHIHIVYIHAIIWDDTLIKAVDPKNNSSFGAPKWHVMKLWWSPYFDMVSIQSILLSHVWNVIFRMNEHIGKYMM